MSKRKLISADSAALRRRAEERLGERKAQDVRPATKQDTLRLLHELQVHQIEMEMQNEELIAARKELEAGLERYTDLYDFAPVGYFTLGRDGAILQVNLTGARLLGLERANLVKRRLGLFVSPADRKAFSTFLDKVFEGNGLEACEVSICRQGQPSTASKRFEGASGLHVHIDATAAADGQTCRAAVTDIAERKGTQSRIELAAEVLGILNRSNDLERIIDDILRLFKKNLGFEVTGIRLRDGCDFPYFVQNGFPDHFVQKESHLCSYDQAGQPVLDAAGKPVLECMCGNVLMGRTDPAKPLFTEGGSFWTNSTTDMLASTTENDRQVRARNRCNGEGYESVALIPIRSGSDIIGLLQLNDRRRDLLSPQLVQFLEGLGQSIGVAVKRQQAEQSLRESEERFRTLIEAVTDYTYRAIVRDGRVVETTHGPGCLGLTGYSPEEFRADPDLWFRMVPPEDQPTVLEWATKLSSGQKVGPLEHQVVHKNGQTRWVRNSAVPRHDRLGQYTGYEGLIQDFTDYKRLQDQFAQAQKMEAIGQLAGGVAHDFRNQLAVVIGYAEMLLRRNLVNDKGRAKVQHIIEAADRSTRITGQLLAFSRQQTLQPEVINVNSVTADMMKSLAQTIGEDIRLSIVPNDELWSIRVDPGQFQQALLNLVLNARDAMPRGGRLAIETENVVLDEDFARQHVGISPGRHVVLTVSDTGDGMSPETLGHIFEPFFTTKPRGKGTGLGLAMIHGFVVQSGGAIDVQSMPDKGTTFRLHFPAVASVADSAQPASRTQELSRGSGAVLVVEDEQAIRRMLLETLGECGYTVKTAGNAQEAMALIDLPEQVIDLLVTDVVMPGWSGAELAKHFKAARPGVPVLMISGYTGTVLTGHGVVPADVNLLIKPFSSQSIVETVQKILNQTVPS